MDACYEQDAVALQRALAAGGDVNARETGGWTARHRRDVVPTQVPKFPQLPAEIVPTIVAYAFHTGYY